MVEIPAAVLDWRRTVEFRVTNWAAGSATRNRRTTEAMASFGQGTSAPKALPVLEVGDRVVHTVFGMGRVLALSGPGPKQTADVDFGSGGTKRLSLAHAPMEKL